MEEGGKIRPNPFRVPENYFDEVNRRILSSTVDISVKRKMLSAPQFRYFLAIAASIAVLITTVYFPVKILEKKSGSPGVAQIIISSPEVLLDEIDLLTLENSAAGSVFEQKPDLTKDEIIDYLVDEDIDISMIYEKL